MRHLPHPRASAEDLRGVAAAWLSAPGAIVTIPDEVAALRREVDRCLRLQAEWLISEALLVDAIASDGRRHPYLGAASGLAPRKGDPEFDPDQPRDELGQWTDDVYSGADEDGADALAQAISEQTDRTRNSPSELLRDDEFREESAVRARDLQGFRNRLAQRTDLTETERTSFALTYTLEGGSKATLDTRGGITAETFAQLRDGARTRQAFTAAGLPRSFEAFRTVSEERFHGYAVSLYKIYLDDVMHTVEGRGSRLQDIGDDLAAAAFFDVLFQDGRGAGTQSIQNATNHILPDLAGDLGESIDLPRKVDVDGRMGPLTFATYALIAAHPDKIGPLLDRLVDARVEYRRNRGLSPTWTRITVFEGTPGREPLPLRNRGARPVRPRRRRR